MAASDYFARIFIQFHYKHFNLMAGACKDAIGKFPADPSFKLYHALALILTNRLEEGVNELEGLTHENDIKLACTIALMYAHKFLGVASRELFVKLDIQMKEYRKSADAHDFYNAAFVLITLNKSEKALDYAEKAISMKSDCEFSSLKGWILLTLKTLSKHNASTIKAVFSKALRDNPKDLLAILGVTECCLYLSELGEALSFINQAVVKFTSTSLPLFEKIKVHFAAQDWDQTLEAINRFTSADCEMLHGTKYEVLISLCRSQDHKAACSGIRRFSELARKFEPNNTAVMLEASRLFSKVSGQRESVLNETIAMLESVMQTNIDSAELVVELGNLYLLLGSTKEAVRLFKSATKIDEGYFEAFLGLSVCEFMDNGPSQQLFKQIQYLLELKGASNSLALHLLQAKAADSSVEALSHLKVIFDIKTHLLQASYYSEKYLINLNPDFTLDVIREYLQHATTNKQVLEHALELANVVAKACPSLPEAVYLQAKLQHLKGDSISALRTLEAMANMSETASSEAGLLMAQIQVNNGQFDRASQSLEACMSSNFKIRENPVCHYITALVDKHGGNFGDAIKALSTALTLMSITVKDNDVSLIDKASIYVELIDTLNIVGQSDEAQKILEEATQDLQGTPEEARILLLSADNLVVRGNIQGALELLGKIGKGESCYREARMKMADMFLKNRRDKYAFLEVYQEFVEEQPSAESYVLLGDACLKILEPDDALQNYEKALKDKPNDLFLMRKMGKALVQTHYFNRAVEYYKKSIKEISDPELKLQLAELYLNLREYEKGELLLLDELDEEHRKSIADDINDLLYRAKLHSLLAEIQEKSGNSTFAVKSLKDAMDCQMRVRKRHVLEQNVASDGIDRQLVDISLKLGDMAISMKNNEQAVSYYKDGLTVSPNNTSILVALAKLYMQMNYLELCQQTCAIILRIDQDNEAASVLMADIAFRKVDFDMALFHFTQLVSKQPNNWDALTRLIEISRRLGTIQDCEQYINVAEEKCANPSKEAGFLYSKAYFQWHSGNLNAALKNFNQVRQDPELGTNALYNMIEICLNPDGEMLAEQFMDSDDIEYRDSRFLALKTADRLIKDLRQRLESKGENLLRCRLLANFRLLATKEKYNIERALEDFVAVASQNDNKENLGAILGMSTAYTLLKQQQRAKNQLKRVVKNAWNFEDAHYLEKCWLLLADQYIQSNKLDSANELIAKVVQHNKACIKALEYLGYICEKEHKYKEASRNYEQAWRVGMKSNASTGFKSAYCLMKCKKYPDAIDTANEVLQLNPDYANVKKDILDKCMNNLRV